MNELEVVNAFARNESKMRSITFGTFGVCAVCYDLSQMTEHHIAPRSVHQKTRDWKPFKVVICRPCHNAVHQMETNENLYMKHKTLLDVVLDIRAHRNGKKCSNKKCNTRISYGAPDVCPKCQSNE